MFFKFYTFDLFQEKIIELEDIENLEEESNKVDDIPKMKMDVMGLDYSAIMTRVRYLLIIFFYYICIWIK